VGFFSVGYFRWVYPKNTPGFFGVRTRVSEPCFVLKLGTPVTPTRQAFTPTSVSAFHVFQLTRAGQTDGQTDGRTRRVMRPVGRPHNKKFY